MIFNGQLYLIPFLHQTTTLHLNDSVGIGLYLIPFLHQTTTSHNQSIFAKRCILFHFYIKPQRLNFRQQTKLVVSYSISTSNHNDRRSGMDGL